MCRTLGVLLVLSFLQVIPAQKGIIQKPPLIIADEGESVNITCQASQGTMDGMKLKREVVNDMTVLTVVENPRNISPRYAQGIEFVEVQNTFVITLRELQKNDTDVYYCRGIAVINGNHNSVSGSGTMLVVRDKCLEKMKQEERPSLSWLLYVLAFLGLFSVSLLGYIILSHIDIKKHCRRGKKGQAQNIVYEDMNCSLRRNNMATLNVYQNRE
uniref:CD7 molecule n=1 Tax=Sphenodon punctatus TaxID=8508 RepID=A0A8D0GS44_SPHPU